MSSNRPHDHDGQTLPPDDTSLIVDVAYPQIDVDYDEAPEGSR